MTATPTQLSSANPPQKIGLSESCAPNAPGTSPSSRDRGLGANYWGWLIVFIVAVALTMLFWWPLWSGGGLIGGDIYAYFLPQKAFYAERLKAGEFPLWNNRVGNGYPLVAESQTGAFYPLHAPLYRLLELNTAYNASLILHYVLGFLFTWLYARRWGLGVAPAALTALVYVYGWFPPRVSLEWSMIGGTWLPAALWLVEGFLQTRRWRYPIWLTVVLAVQMLAGHFTLAFVTQLTLACYVPLRLWMANSDLPSDTQRSRNRLGIAVAVALLAAFGLAGMQLLPTWELKQRSQRLDVSQEHDPGYGHIPLRYWTQIFVPWKWYPEEESGEAERRLQQLLGPGDSRTNRVEAHLYFGLVPLVLALGSLIAARKALQRRDLVWVVLGGASFIYTSGWLIGITRHLPGFSFFEGPARFGIVTTLAAALLAGAGMQALMDRRSPMLRRAFVVVLFLATTADLWIVSRLVTSAWLVDYPPIKFLSRSVLRDIFTREPQPPRLFTKAKNLPSVLGTGTLPIYLGLGPAPYFDPKLTIPEPLPFDVPPTPEQLQWLRRAGITHLLSEHPLASRDWPVKLLWQGPDRFYNPANARDEEIFLYSLSGSRGRVAWQDPQPGGSARIVDYRANRVDIAAHTETGGTLLLTDLAYPGWEVTVDGVSAIPLTIEGMYRGVQLSAGKHAVVWTYRPASLYWGLGISAATGAILLILGHLRYWHPHLFRRAAG